MVRWDGRARATRSGVERGAPSLRAAAVRHLGAAAAVLASALASVPSPAVAESGDAVPLEWRAPAACPSRGDVLASLASLQHVDASGWQRFERVRGDVTRLAAAFRLELEFVAQGSVRRREFVTRSCADLAHAAAVALALALDPSWDRWTAPDAEGGAANTPSNPALEPVAAPSGELGESASMEPIPALAAAGGASAVDDETQVERAPGGGSATPVALVLGVEAVFDPVSLGGPAFGVGGAARLRATAWAAEAYATWLPEASIDIGAGMGVDMALLAGGARGCHLSGAHLALCLELEAGRLTAQGWGFSAARSASDPWLAPGVGVELSSPVAASVALRSRISLMLPVIRPDYFVNDGEKIHDVPAVVLRFALGATLPVL